MERKKIVGSFMWAAIETYSSQGVAFIVSIFMARILMPADYGVLGIISIFLALSDTFVDSGFTNALIHRQNCSIKDYSTVYYFNILISVVFFIILFFCAPLIADFYNDDVLTWTTRVMALGIIISSFGAVPMTILTKELRFKAKATITLMCSVTTGAFGIALAYTGFGVWALVLQAVFGNLFKMIICVIVVKWKPALVFSKQSFKELFGFGSKLLGSSIIHTIYGNIYNLVIGKVFNPTQLGYYTRADGYSRLIPINLSGVLSKILLPILSKEQNNDAELIKLHNQFILTTSYFIFPGCLFLAGFASPLVFLLITEKWMPIVSILQILCIAGIFDHFSSINGNFILAKGKSGFFLKMNMVSKPIGIILLAISLIWNLETVAFGKVLYSVLCLFLSYFYLRKILNIDLRGSLNELGKILFISFGISLFVYFIYKHILYQWATLIPLGIISLLSYFFLVKMFCPTTHNLIIKLIRRQN